MGGVVRTVTGKPMKGEKPSKENYGNPYAEDLMARFVGAVDAYNARRFGGEGIKNYVPKEQQPYEWRSDEERAAIRAREETQADEEDRPRRNLAINESDEADAPDAAVKTKAGQAQPPGVSMVPVSTTVDPELRKRALQQAMANTKFAPQMRFRG